MKPKSLELTEADFDEIIVAGQLIPVSFWADWYGSYRLMKLIVEA